MGSFIKIKTHKLKIKRLIETKSIFIKRKKFNKLFTFSKNIIKIIKYKNLNININLGIKKVKNEINKIFIIPKFIFIFRFLYLIILMIFLLNINNLLNFFLFINIDLVSISLLILSL